MWKNKMVTLLACRSVFMLMVSLWSTNTVFCGGCNSLVMHTELAFCRCFKVVNKDMAICVCGRLLYGIYPFTGLEHWTDWFGFYTCWFLLAKGFQGTCNPPLKFMMNMSSGISINHQQRVFYHITGCTLKSCSESTSWFLINHSEFFHRGYYVIQDTNYMVLVTIVV